MASFTHGCRLLQLVGHPEQFEGSSWEFRLAFVHFYHDLREARPGPVNRLVHNEVTFLITLQIFTAVAVAAVVSQFLALTTPTVAVIFLCALLIVDGIYRLPLACSSVTVDCTIQSPWLALSLRDFWSRHWNLVIQRMLKDGIYRPMRVMGHDRERAGIMTFLVSGILHAYPLLVLGVETYPNIEHAIPQAAKIMLFFILQPALIAFEDAVHVRSRLALTCNSRDPPALCPHCSRLSRQAMGPVGSLSNPPPLCTPHHARHQRERRTPNRQPGGGLQIPN